MSNRENETRENSQNRNNKEGVSSKNFLAGAVVGGVVGAVAALLLTPRAGKEVRGNLNTKLNNFVEKTTQLGDDVFEKSNGLAAATREKTASLSKVVVQQSKELVNRAKNLSANTGDQQAENETNYISIDSVSKPEAKKDIEVNVTAGAETDIRKKLEEAQRAFEEEENKIKK